MGRVNPYQRSRQRGVVGVSKTLEENLPGPYESKVYGLPQNPTLTDGLDETTGSGPASYIDTAISHAEVTWSQDPFRQDSFQSGEREPTFDIDFSKDPSNKIASQAKPADIGFVNLFPLKDEPSNAIDSFNKGTFVFNSPVGRSEVTSGVRRKVVVGRPVVNAEVVSQVTPHISASIKTVPRIQPARIVPQFLKEEPVPQITTISRLPLSQSNCLILSLSTEICDHLFYETEGILISLFSIYHVKVYSRNKGILTKKKKKKKKISSKKKKKKKKKS